MPRILRPVLCYVTDRASLPRGVGRFAVTHEEADLPGLIGIAAAAGVDWIQIREKDLAAARLAALTREALRRVGAAAPSGGARVIVNDRFDVAIAAGAGGVHLGETSLPPADVVRWLRSQAGRAAVGEDFLVGVSCHSVAAARAAEAAGADYLFFGPVFVTPSKANFGAPQGLERLAEACSAVKVPVLAIGGITIENAGVCIAAGASGIAAIRMFQETNDLLRVVEALRIAMGSP